MKTLTTILTLTIEEAEIICGKMRTLASSYIMNGNDDEAIRLMNEIKWFENTIKEAVENENTAV